MSVADKMNPAAVTKPPPMPPREGFMNHVFYKTGDADAPDQIKDGNGEVVLSLCRNCGQAEGEIVYGRCVPTGTNADIKPKLPAVVSAADILADMAQTFRERNAIYGDNYKMVGRLMAVLFPDGVSPELLHSHQFHLFELKLVKLSRFAISKLQHVDSIHDDAVYSAMIEMILQNEVTA